MAVGDKKKSIKDLQRAKGVRDIAPDEKIVMQKMMDTMRVVFENYGYSPLETPILERSELYDVKFGQGEGTDAIQESFRLTDKANRKLILRNELTAPLAIYIASNPNTKMPFKRYEMGRVFRNGPLKAGRYREFWQCDVDVVGVDGVMADAEMIEIMIEVFKRLDIEIEIQFNSRKLLNEILESVDVRDEEIVKQVLVVMDKYEKLNMNDFKTELDKLMDSDKVTRILRILPAYNQASMAGKNIKDWNREKIENIEKELPESEGLKDIKKILERVGNNQDVVFVPSLVRGQAYYTGPIFEVYAKDKSKISSSLAGGGRYDEMISGYLQDGKSYPATGTSFGLSAIYDYLVDSIKDKQKTVAQVYIIFMGDEAEKMAINILRELRNNNIKSDMDMLGKNMKKNLNYVNEMGIPFAVIIGEDEVRENLVMLKDMETGEQEKIAIDKVVEVMKTRLY